MRGRAGGDIGTVVEGLAPFLDVLIDGSTEVNECRAEQSGSVALPAPRRRTARRRRPQTPAPEAVPKRRLLSAREAARAPLPEPARREAPEVEFSLFVQLSEDLDPAARAETEKAVRRLCRRSRWKQDAASVEVLGENVGELRALRGVTYVEPGQALHSPEPLFLGESGAPVAATRRVGAQAARHRYGADVLVGVIDVGGFDFAHPDFLDGRRRTRWRAIWDQGGTVRPAPASRGGGLFGSFDYGSELLGEQMNAAIAAAPQWGLAPTSLEPQSVMVPESHGTHVASIAAGNTGVARRALLAGVLVALRPEDMVAASSFYDSTRIADAVDYLLALAADVGGEDGPLPVSINISLGTNGHAHDTSSAMARWIDSALATPGRCVTVAAGNAGQVEPLEASDRGLLLGRIHAGGSLAATGLSVELGWMVGLEGVADVSDNEMEIWYASQDRVEVEIKPPGHPWVGPIRPGERIRNERLSNGTLLSVHSETYHPANGANRISIVLSPFYGRIVDGVRPVGAIASGEWRVRLTGTVIRDGRYDAWIERDDPRPMDGRRNWRLPSVFSPGTYTDDRMISSLACAERIISVGNIDTPKNMAHVTSSRGPTRDGRFKPDMGADGTEIVAACGFDPGRRWIAMTGTSMASPYVCGVAALMLGVAPRLTSAQIVGIMRTTSRPLPGQSFAWRNDTGFGVIDAAACVKEAAVFEPLTRRRSGVP